MKKILVNSLPLMLLAFTFGALSQIQLQGPELATLTNGFEVFLLLGAVYSISRVMKRSTGTNPANTEE